MDKKVLKAQDRTVTGRKVKKLRKQGLLPGNVYGMGVKSMSVQVEYKDFAGIYKELGETGLLELKIGDKTKHVLIHGIQVDPKTGTILHADFREVNLKVKVTAMVPVEVAGESPAEKQGIGTVVQQINEVEVEALPADLPEKFEVNVELLAEVDQAVYVKNLKFDSSKVEIKSDPEAIIAKVEPPQKEEAVEPPATTTTTGAEVAAEEHADNQDTSSEASK